MPILPIDLQAIFVQLGNVGKEQAVQRGVAPLQQTAQASQMVEQTYQHDRSVNEAKDSREGVRVDDREGQGQRRGGEGKKKGAEEQAESPRDRGEGVFRDPALGTHIDVVR